MSELAVISNASTMAVMDAEAIENLSNQIFSQGPDALATMTKEFNKDTDGVRSWLKDMATGHAKGTECAPLVLMQHLREMTVRDHRFTMLLLDVSDLSIALDRAVTAVFAGIANTYFREDSVQTKWNVEPFKDDLDTVDAVIERMLKDTKQLQLAWEELLSEKLTESMLQVEDEIWKCNFDEVDEVLQQHRDWDKRRRELDNELKKQEAELAITESTVEILKQDIDSNTEELKLLQSKLKKQEEKRDALEAKQQLSAEEHEKELRKEREENKEELAALMKQKKEGQTRIRQESQKKRKAEEAKLLSLQDKLVDATKGVRNHIIFIVDSSGSMSGTRWQNALMAMEAMMVRRKTSGSMDRASVVAFSHTAEVVISYVNITTEWLQPLHDRTRPGGATSYVAAWDMASKAVDRGQDSDKLLFVFITDGLPSESMQRSVCSVQALHKRCQNRGMMTLIVNVDKVVADDVLMPLVRAANGGAELREVVDRKVPMLVNVAAKEMVPTFEGLGALIHAEEERAKAQVSQTRERLKEYEKEEEEESKRFEAMLREEEEEMSRQLQKKKKWHAREMEDEHSLLESRKSEVNAAIERLENFIETRKTNMQTKRETLTQMEKSIEIEKKALEDFKKAHEEEVESLRKMQQNTRDHLAKQADKHADSLRDAGTVSGRRVLERLDQLQHLKEMYKARQAQMQGFKTIVWMFMHFSQSAARSIRQPPSLADISEGIDQKARAVFPVLFKDWGVVFEGDADSNPNLQKAFKYEAQRLGDDDAQISEALKVLSKVGMKSEDFCEGCGKEGREKTKAEAIPMEKLRRYVLRKAKIDTEAVKKLEQEQKNKKETKEKLQRMRGEKKKGRRQSTADSEDDKVEDDDDESFDEEALENKIEEMDGTIEKLEEEVDRGAEEMDKHGLEEDIVKSIVAQCDQVYEKIRVKEVRGHLERVWRSFQGKVGQPMKELQKVSRAVRMALEANARK